MGLSGEEIKPVGPSRRIAVMFGWSDWLVRALRCVYVEV